MSRKTIQPNLSYDNERSLYYVTVSEGKTADGKRQRRTQTFHTYAEALAALGHLKPKRGDQAMEHGPMPINGDCTLREWVCWWLEEEMAPNHAASTIYAYRNMARCHILPSLGKVTLRRLTPMRLQSYLHAQRNAGLSPNTVLKHYVFLMTALRRAMMLDLLSSNPMEKVVPPKKLASKYTFYTPEQMRTLFTVVEGTMLELAVKLAAYLGLRRSEICGLRWDCVDLEREVIIIREVRTEVGGEEVVKAPKTATSIRRLGIGGLRDLQSVLRRAWQQRRTDDPREYVLLCADGTRPLPDYLTAQLLAVVRRHRLPKITMHGLRHSFASVANSQGVPMFDISRTLGHSSITVTSGIYTHLFDETQTETLRTVAAAIEP